VLVGGVLLLDCGPETPRQAVRAGRRLDGVRAVWVGHDHPDHSSPMALLARSWARRPDGEAHPLTVVGPGAVIDAWRPWAGADEAVDFRPICAGEEVTVAGHRLLALPAAHAAASGEALLCLVTDPAGRRLLYATDTGPLPEAALDLLPRQPLDVVLMDETFGARTDLAARGDHLDLAGFGAQVRRLRDRGAVGPPTAVIAVHLSHHNPPEAELAVDLAAVGAVAGRDGQTLAVDPSGRGDPSRGARARGGERVLVLGGARSGKSRIAERMLADVPDVVYVATGHPAADDDVEWAARVARHRDRRPVGWRTVETTDVAALLRADGPPLLVDCLTLWLSRTLDAVGAWQADRGWEDRADDALADLREAWEATTRTVVAVANEVGSGIVPATATGRLFRDLQGRLNATLAAGADRAYLVVAGRAVPLPAAGVPPAIDPGGHT
jgi:adenosylcobinamide kinase/adenosylcobinamide-phosphate guanylyltransferase